MARGAPARGVAAPHTSAMVPIVDEDLPVLPVVHPTAAMAFRRSFKVEDTMALGKRAAAFRSHWLAAHGHLRGWLSTFTRETYQDIVSPQETARERARIWRAALKAMEAEELAWSVRNPALCSRKGRPSRRKRSGYPGRRVVLPELWAELWAFFVPRAPLMY